MNNNFVVFDQPVGTVCSGPAFSSGGCGFNFHMILGVIFVLYNFFIYLFKKNALSAGCYL